ncbi:hypothetical protein LDENG_00146220 [Lucifuga dentata]|nr:hypothetical protein LDENG_00146220 [Lucifuga dentata]
MQNVWYGPLIHRLCHVSAANMYLHSICSKSHRYYGFGIELSFLLDFHPDFCCWMTVLLIINFFSNCFVFKCVKAIKCTDEKVLLYKKLHECKI